MNWQLWVVVIDLIISGIIVVGRGLAGTVRRYDLTDTIGALIEVPLVIVLILWGT